MAGYQNYKGGYMSKRDKREIKLNKLLMSDLSNDELVKLIKAKGTK